MASDLLLRAHPSCWLMDWGHFPRLKKLPATFFLRPHGSRSVFIRVWHYVTLLQSFQWISSLHHMLPTWLSGSHGDAQTPRRSSWRKLAVLVAFTQETSVPDAWLHLSFPVETQITFWFVLSKIASLEDSLHTWLKSRNFMSMTFSSQCISRNEVNVICFIFLLFFW